MQVNFYEFGGSASWLVIEGVAAKSRKSRWLPNLEGALATLVPLNFASFHSFIVHDNFHLLCSLPNSNPATRSLGTLSEDKRRALRRWFSSWQVFPSEFAADFALS
jgi:hypothetical protein